MFGSNRNLILRFMPLNSSFKNVSEFIGVFESSLGDIGVKIEFWVVPNIYFVILK